MKKIIITASDEKFSPIAMGLLRSLHQWDSPACDEVGMLDLGLSAQTRKAMEPYVTRFVEPGWDFDVSEVVKLEKPHVRALLARPRLRDYFPGHDLYLWLDADMWLQERFPVDWFFDASRQGAMGLVPSADRSYVYHPSHIRWRQGNLLGYFGQEALDLYALNPYYNAGAFSLRADAPHWDAWGQYFVRALSVDPNRTSDQAILNFMLWKESLPVHPLPSLCNWLCQYAIPHISRQDGKLREPHIPHRLIGLLHLAAKSKSFILNVEDGDRKIQINLHYGGRAALLDRQMTGDHGTSGN